MTDPEKVIMKGTAQALAMDPDRIHGGVSTREGITGEEVGWAIAGMKDAGVPDQVVRRVNAALGYLVLGDDNDRWTLYQELVKIALQAIRRERWPERLDGRLYHEALATLAIYAAAIPPLDQLLRGEEAMTWCREFGPKYTELRTHMEQWKGIGMAHVRRRTADEEEQE